MKIYFYFLILLLIAFIKSQNNCKTIIPNKSSDCLLSSEDKKIYTYCCYKNDKYGKECFAFDNEDYKIVMRMNQDEYYDPNLEFICNSASFIKLGMIFFIFCIF